MRNYQEETSQYMQSCMLCPRKCGVNRLEGQVGFCGQTSDLRLARAALHFWEEPCISGTRGSGTVFFSGCGLRCVFCQNHDIALGKSGKTISVDRLATIFLELQEQGAHNINLVTPTHYIPQIADALHTAKEKGLTIPIVYNSSGYEEISSLQLLEGLIDIYLPDCKYYSPEVSMEYAHATDYFEKTTAALKEMYRQVGTPILEAETGLMKRGMIVRHLLLPGKIGDAKKILRHLHNTFKNDIYVSIMNQYTPLPHVNHIPELSRKVTPEEYQRVLAFADAIGIEQGFMQEGETSSESFIPPFNYEGV